MIVGAQTIEGRRVVGRNAVECLEKPPQTSRPASTFARLCYSTVRSSAPRWASYMGHGHCVTQRTDQSEKRASMSFSVNSGYFAFVSSSLSSATAAAKPDQKMKLPGTQFRAEGSGLCPWYVVDSVGGMCWRRVVDNGRCSPRNGCSQAGFGCRRPTRRACHSFIDRQFVRLPLPPS